MRIRRKNMRKLVSLSALGVGGMAVGVQQAAASITYVDLSGSPAKVGFDTADGFGHSFAGIVMGSTAQFQFRATGDGANPFTRQVKVYGNHGTMQFATDSTQHRLQLVSANKKWSTRGATGIQAYGLLAKRNWTTGDGSNHSVQGHSSFTDGYGLFTFQNAGQTDYGWVLVSLQVTDQPGGDPAAGPNVTIEGYAFDTTADEQIAAGDTGQTVPEPATFTLSGLGALALGAVGIRRWRAARKAA
jgi:hypothetical protein